MVIIENQKIIPIYCYIEYDEAKFIYSEQGFKTCIGETHFDGEIPLIKKECYKGQVVNYYSSIPEISIDLFKKILTDDYSSNDERDYYIKKIKQVNINLTQVSCVILEEYYHYKIKRNELELWKNNFENKVFEMGNNSFYIDDDNFEIFYTITNEGEFEFESLGKH